MLLFFFFKKFLNNQRRDEGKYIELIIDILNSGLFYYSKGFDLSNSIQRLNKIYSNHLPFGKNSNVNLWQNVDDRFVWNSHLIDKFIPFQSQFGNWFHPIIQGFAKSNTDCRLSSSSSFNFLLISRRSKQRVGTRFNSRG